MSEVITMPTSRIDPKSQDSLDALGLSEAADNCVFHEMKCDSVDELIARMNEADIATLPGMTPEILAEIFAKVNEFGIAHIPGFEVIASPLATAAVEPETTPDETSPEAETTTEPEIDKAEAERIRLEEYDRETLRIINQLEEEVRDDESYWQDLHSNAQSAKKVFEAAEANLRQMIRSRRENREKPPEQTLFTGSKAAPIELGNNATPATVGQVDENLWQKYPICFEQWERFGLTKSDCEKLNSGETRKHGTHPMTSLGDVTRFITPDPANPSYARTLKDVKGFGDAAMERWTEAELKFWNHWNNGGSIEFAASLGELHEALHGVDPGELAGSRTVICKDVFTIEDARGDAEPIIEAVITEVPTDGNEAQPEVESESDSSGDQPADWGQGNQELPDAKPQKRQRRKK